MNPEQGRRGLRTPRAQRASELGTRLTAGRQRRSWTQERLAAHTGAGLRTVLAWGTGETTPRGLYAKVVAKFLAGE